MEAVCRRLADDANLLELGARLALLGAGRVGRHAELAGDQLPLLQGAQLGLAVAGQGAEVDLRPHDGAVRDAAEPHVAGPHEHVEVLDDALTPGDFAHVRDHLVVGVGRLGRGREEGAALVALRLVQGLDEGGPQEGGGAHDGLAIAVAGQAALVSQLGPRPGGVVLRERAHQVQLVGAVEALDEHVHAVVGPGGEAEGFAASDGDNPGVDLVVAIDAVAEGLDGALAALVDVAVGDDGHEVAPPRDADGHLDVLATLQLADALAETVGLAIALEADVDAVVLQGLGGRARGGLAGGVLGAHHL